MKRSYLIVYGYVLINLLLVYAHIKAFQSNWPMLVVSTLTVQIFFNVLFPYNKISNKNRTKQ